VSIPALGIILVTIEGANDDVVEPVRLSKSALPSELVASMLFFQTGNQRIFGMENLKLTNFNEMQYIIDGN
jgi:hypothetical protein